mgnify:CR=1 FL=1
MLERPNEGTITFDGMDITDSSVDMYIVNELFKTVDFGYSSVKFYTKKDSSGNEWICSQWNIN